MRHHRIRKLIVGWRRIAETRIGAGYALLAQQIPDVQPRESDKPTTSETSITSPFRAAPA